MTALNAADAYADFDAQPQPLAAARGERLVFDAALRQLAELLRWPREDRDCPDRNY